MKKVTVHSGGTGMDTVLVDEDGHRIEGVQGVDIFIAAGEVNNVTLQLALAEIVVEGVVTAVQAHCPMCNCELEHKCQTVLNQVDPPQGEEMTFKIKEITNAAGAGLFSGNGLSFQGGTLKVVRVDP